MIPIRFPAARSEGLRRLAAFVPHAGRDYASGRNTDFGPEEVGAVSKLSPYLRYRMVTEEEAVRSVLAGHSLAAAEKFVQEVLWRTYWKGWLEMRPMVWARFLEERDHQRASFPNARAITAAENGMTGIDGFDDWARELVETGYLHNHARMWFASIWIFTLRLPWTLGADFFLRHLIDADAASNTLSWRWVAGLQTAGKTYLATADNIARYTNGRFAPKGLAQEAAALTEAPISSAAELPHAPGYDRTQPALLLVTPEDLYPESLFAENSLFSGLLIVRDPDILWGNNARDFVNVAATDAGSRLAAHFGCSVSFADKLDAASLISAAQSANAVQIVMPYAPVGAVADALRALEPALTQQGITLGRVCREWDTQFWPHAKKGFFPFKERIPAILQENALL
jgi:deoxyribodipyrimidine photo-lyase